MEMRLVSKICNLNIDIYLRIVPVCFTCLKGRELRAFFPT